MNNSNKKEIYQKTLILLYILFIFIFSISCLKPGSDSSQDSLKIAKIISELFGVKQTDNFNSLIRKLIGHFAYFGVFSIISTFMFFTFDKIKLKWQIVLNYSSIIIFILFSEFVLQMVAIDRGPSIRDCMIDFLGFLIGSVFIYIYYFMYNYVINKKLYDNKKVHLIYTIVVGTIYVFSIILFIILAKQTGGDSKKVSDSITEPVTDIGNAISGVDSSGSNENVRLFVRKLIGHFSFFAEIGFFSFLFYYSITKLKKIHLLLIHLFVGISFAYITEFLIEKGVFERTPTINDFYTNSMGFISITAIFLIVILLVKLNNHIIKSKNV
ncbi:MAG: VanZ family protein [Acholeplasmatales bacterium]|nr:VanZ family protein [Acholeplasmatales bacterium]